MWWTQLLKTLLKRLIELRQLQLVYIYFDFQSSAVIRSAPEQPNIIFRHRKINRIKVITLSLYCLF